MVSRTKIRLNIDESVDAGMNNEEVASPATNNQNDISANISSYSHNNRNGGIKENGSK